MVCGKKGVCLTEGLVVKSYMENAQINNTLFVKVHPYMPEKICIHLYASKLSVLESFSEEQQ